MKHEYLSINDGDAESMSVDTSCIPVNVIVRTKADEQSAAEKLAIENRRSDVREFLESMDYDDVKQIHDANDPPLTHGEIVELIMSFPQAMIDRIWKDEGLDQPPLDKDERQQS